MSHPSQSSSLYDPSPSFDAALAAVDLTPPPPPPAQPEAHEPPLKRRRVTWKEECEQEIVDRVKSSEEKVDPDQAESVGAVGPRTNDDDEDADGDEDDDDESGLHVLASSYLEDAAYNASKFGGIHEYLKHRRIKLQNQNKAIADSRSEGKIQMFKGLEIYINGHVRPSLQILREMIMEHGGTYIPFLDRKGMVTHIIASNLTPSKFREFRTYKVVKPEWLTASVDAGRLLDWREFKLVAEGGTEAGMRGGMMGWMGSQKKESQRKSELESDHSETAAQGKGEANSKRRRTRSPSPPTSVAIAGLAPLQRFQPAVVDKNHSVMSQTQTVSPPPPVTPMKSLKRPVSEVSPSPAVMLTDGPTDQHTPIVSKPIAPIFSPYRKPINPSKVMEGPNDVGSDPITFDGESMNGYARHQEHPDGKRLIKDNEWRLANTAANGEGFIEGYYQNSRLHHLSSWKAELKVLVAQAQNQAESTDLVQSLAPGAISTSDLSLATSVLPRPELRHVAGPGMGSSNRLILHIDFDAFFVSCGIATRPELRGKPVVVCHSQSKTGAAGSTSEIASCSYEAREKGVRNGMSLGQARRLCPDVQTIPYEFDTYKKHSLTFYTILMAYADELQAVSVDEALIDATSRVQALASAPIEFNAELCEAGQVDREKDWVKVLAEKIRDDVRKATNCEVSIGAAHNILLARLATRKAKPAGSHHLKAEEVQQFLSGLTVSDLPNFGWATCKKIEEEWGTTSCGDLLDKPKSLLKATLGDKTGETLYGFLRGVDHRKLEPHKERKSVSAEVNYGIRFISTEEAEDFILNLSKEVSKRLKAIKRTGRQITLKIMKRHPDASIETPKFMGHGVCEVFNKSAPIGSGSRATDDPAIIGTAALKIMRSYAFDPAELRGIGIQIQKLEGGAEAGVTPGQATLTFKQAAKDPPTSKATANADATPSRVASPVPAVPAERENKKPVPKLSKFGWPPSVVSAGPSRLAVPDPHEIDTVIWDYMSQEDQEDYRLRWRAKGITVPKHLGGELSGAKGKSGGPVKRGKSAEPAKKRKANDQPTLSRMVSRSREPTRSVTPAHGQAIIDIDSSPAKKDRASAASSELLELGISADVFRALDAEDQEQQLQYYRQKQLLTKKAPSIKVQPIHRVLSPFKPTKAKDKITVDALPRPTFQRTTSVEDIITQVDDWMNVQGDSLPIKKEVNVLQKYVVRCINPTTGGLGGVHDAVQVMSSWKRMMQRKWSGKARMDVEVAKAWKAAFKEVHDAVDAAALARFGSGLILP